MCDPPIRTGSAARELAQAGMLLPLAYFSTPQNWPVAAFMRQLVGAAYPFIHSISFRSPGISVDELAGLGRIEAVFEWHDCVDEALIYLDDGTPAYLHSRRRDELAVELAGFEHQALLRHAEALRQLLERQPPEQEDIVEVNFHTGRGAGSIRPRALQVPRFADIAGNYAADTRRQLERLIALRPEAALAGRLLLWQGKPGTGKTWALRALAREWSDWCEVDYITDPERFLGPEPDYMLEVIASGDADSWHLVVLEDAGELLTLDARMQVGQAFARLLNLTDGLLGQGMKVFVLVTTNEKLGRLHPAVTRPGRVLGEVEFARLSAGESADWLARRGVHRPIAQAQPLADLYAALRDHAE